MRFRIPKIDLRVSALDIILIVLGTIFLVLTILVPEPVFQSISSSVAASFYFFLLTRALEALNKLVTYRRFRRFFGGSVMGEQFFLVYPDFVLNAEVRSLVLRSFAEQGIYTKERSLFKKTYRIDIPRCVAINDITALIQFVSLFGEVLARPPGIRSDDEAVRGGGDSFLSFGLSSNECTHLYFDVMNPPLFQIVQEAEAARYQEFIRAEFPIGDGTEVREYRSDDRREIGIFVKHRPDPESNPDRVWMICAGVGPQATIGVALYVARNWERIFKRVDEEDFLAVFCVAPYAAGQADLLALRTLDKTIILDRKTIS